MSESIVGLYTITSITTDKYDRYEKKLLLYCYQQGWENLQYYRDRAGGTADEGELQQLAQAFGDIFSGKASDVDADHIGRRLAEMSNTDAQHDRDDLQRLMADINAGLLNVVVVHDLSQLGKSKLEAFSVLSAMMNKVEVHMPEVGRIHNDTPVPSGSPSDFF